MPRNRNPYSNESLLAELRRVSELVKERSLTKKRFDSFSKISSSVVCRRLGYWPAALRAAGLSHRDSDSVLTKPPHEYLRLAAGPASGIDIQI